MLLALASPWPAASLSLGADDSATFTVGASPAELVAGSVTGTSDRLRLDGHSSNVNVVAVLRGSGYARLEPSSPFAPLWLETQPAGRGAVPALAWGDNRLADSSDSLVLVAARCGPGAAQERHLGRIRADGGEVAVLTREGWDRAKLADGRLGTEADEVDRAKDVVVRICGAAFTPTRIRAGPEPSAEFSFAALFPWNPRGEAQAVEFLGGAPVAQWVSWGPHDFLPATPDDP